MDAWAEQCSVDRSEPEISIALIATVLSVFGQLVCFVGAVQGEH